MIRSFAFPGAAKRRGVRSFILLEVIISMVIVGIALASVLRSFTNALRALSRERTATTAVLLAQALLDDFEISPPDDSRVQNDCGQDFPGFSYVAEFEDEEIKYRDVDIGFEKRDFVTLKKVSLRIYHQRPSQREPERELHIETYLTGIEKFDMRTKLTHGLF